MVAYLKKTEGSEGFHQIVDFLNTSHIRYALTENPTIYVSLIQQFWQTATASTLDNGEMEITATIDGKVKIVTEASIRRHLKLEDSDGISNLPTTEIFEQLALMGSKKTAWEQFSSNIATAIICLATNRTFNFSKLIFDVFQTATASTLDNGEMEITAIIDGKIKIVTEASIRRHLKLEDSDGISNLPTTEFLNNLLLWGPIFQGEGSTVPIESHHTLTGAPLTSQPHLSPTLRSSIRQETEVPQPSSPPHTNVADEVAFIGVDVRYRGATTTVTVLEARHGSDNIDKTPTMPHDSPLLKVHTLGSDEGRMQHNELIDLLIKKVKRLEKKDKLSKSRRKLRLVLSDEEGSDSDILAQEDPSKQGRKIAQINEDEGITLVLMGVSIAIKTAGDSVNDIAAESLVYIRRSASKTKDKGKGIMKESESAMTKTKRQQEQERLGYEAAMRLQKQLDKEERNEADEELAQRLQAEEREKYSEAEKARLLAKLINQRKRHFAQQRAEERRNNPPTQAQQRTYMVNTFTLMESDVDITIPKIAAGSTKRAAEEELGQQSLRWIPIGRKFNLVGKPCPPSRNPSTIVVPQGKILTITSVEIVLWYLDSGCSKHMTRHRDKFINFVSKFIGTIRFDNDHFAAIKGYEDLYIRNITILQVYYVEGLGHNIFSVGQFCDLDLEVAFRKHTFFIRNLEDVDLPSRSHGSNLYTILMDEMMKSSPICLLSKAPLLVVAPFLSQLNFRTINQLAKQGLVKGLPKLKYTKDHLCSACQMGKIKKEPYPHKPEPSTNEKLQMLHMDLCGPMRVASINEKRYILVIVDDYS
ncbi:hypothetical protein Tco_0065691 [Tanacetum coccineum]